MQVQTWGVVQGGAGHVIYWSGVVWQYIGGASLYIHSGVAWWRKAGPTVLCIVV